MKQTLLTRLVLGAIAGIAAAGVANAGQIQASSVSIAREVITVDTQTVIAPSIAYRFAGDVDARVQSQTFQVQFTLAAGEWAAAPTAGALSVSDGVSGTIINQQAATDGAYSVDNIALSADKKTVFATLTVFKAVAPGVGVLIKQPIISLNVTSNTIGGVALTNVAAQRGTVTKLFSVVGDIVNDYNTTGACEGVKTLAVSFKHYVALTSPASLATDATATADEHTRGGATNAATLMTFPTNVKVSVAAATGGVALTPGGNQTFIVNGAGTAFVNANNALLGTVTLVQNAVGYDANLANQYLLTGPGAAGLSPVATAVSNAGFVETKDVKVTVAATQGFVVGGTLALNTSATCGVGTRLGTTGTVPIVAANAAGPIDLTAATADLTAAFLAAGTGPVYVCYTNPGTVTIPSSQFSAVARVEKAAAGVGLNEQDNICKGSFISLGGGIKIDVRNYASSKETSGYQSVVRLINNSDSRTADVWGQIIHQNGNYGGYGLLATLKPREVLNMTAAQIDAKLITAPAAAAADNGATAPAANAAGAPRLRITSQQGDTLRVQNYLFNSATGQILEASGSQAVDFDSPNLLRAPGSDGQYISQDAQSGLNGAK